MASRAMANMQRAAESNADLRLVVNDFSSKLTDRDLSAAEIELVNRFLERLPPSDREMLNHYWDGVGFSEIAGLLGLEVDTVRTSLMRIQTSMSLWMLGIPDPDGGGSGRQLPPEIARKVASG
ncbi:MAG TPA: sigma factor-like helix-turn-helix DNA-binding protein [Steroidobacter sp.]|uniref:sigma factor-like helix-turn-helix DNA-binding protein n=1 Tax=Steroidobacter sp. TaxID=1978227 RepID=UPI002EDB2648